MSEQEIGTNFDGSEGGVLPVLASAQEEAKLRDAVLQALQHRVGKAWTLANKPTSALLAMECAHLLKTDEADFAKLPVPLLGEIFKNAAVRKSEGEAFSANKSDMMFGAAFSSFFWPVTGFLSYALVASPMTSPPWGPILATGVIGLCALGSTVTALDSCRKFGKSKQALSQAEEELKKFLPPPVAQKALPAPKVS